MIAKDRLPYGYGEHGGRLGTVQLKTTVRFVDTSNPRRIGRWFVGNNKRQVGLNGESLDDHTPGNSVFYFSPNNPVEIPCDDKWKSIGTLHRGKDRYDVYALHHDPANVRKGYPSFYLYMWRLKKR